MSGCQGLCERGKVSGCHGLCEGGKCLPVKVSVREKSIDVGPLSKV